MDDPTQPYRVTPPAPEPEPPPDRVEPQPVDRSPAGAPYPEATRYPDAGWAPTEPAPTELAAGDAAAPRRATSSRAPGRGTILTTAVLSALLASGGTVAILEGSGALHPLTAPAGAPAASADTGHTVR